MASDVSDDAFNVGGGNEVSVREIVDRLLEATGSELEPEVRADQVVPMTRRVGSSEHAIAAPRLAGRSSISSAASRDVVGQVAMRILAHRRLGVRRWLPRPPLSSRPGTKCSPSCGTPPPTPRPTASTVVEADLAEPLASDALPQVDAVAHFAQGNVPFPDEPQALYRVNAASTLELLDHARCVGASASSMPPPPRLRLRRPPSPRTIRCAPHDFYAVTKIAGEQLVGTYAPFLQDGDLPPRRPLRAGAERTDDPRPDRARA